MIDISILRDSPELLKAALVRKGSSLDVDLLVELDVSVRRLRHAAGSDRSRILVVLSAEWFDGLRLPSSAT